MVEELQLVPTVNTSRSHAHTTFCFDQEVETPSVFATPIYTSVEEGIPHQFTRAGGKGVEKPPLKNQCWRHCDFEK